MIFYPKAVPKNNICYYKCYDRCYREQHTLVKIIIEDKTNETLQYDLQLKSESGIIINWNTEFTNSENVVYDSCMTQGTKYIEKAHTIYNDFSSSDPDVYENFKINAELIVKSSSNISHDISSSIELCSSQESEYYDQFETSSIINQDVAPTFARCSAFVECIGKIVDDYKNDSLPDLVILASKLVKAARKFDLPDLEKISTGFLDFQLSHNNFADILEMAIDQEIDALVNISSDYVCNNQHELRGTEQWEKMKACPIMMLSILEKLFIDKDSSGIHPRNQSP